MKFIILSAFFLGILSCKNHAEGSTNLTEDTLKTYWDNGKIKSIYVLKNNIKNGPGAEYYSNGNIASKFYYKNNELIDTLLNFGKNGFPRALGVFDSSGNLLPTFRLWYENGNLSQTVDFNKSDSIETWKMYYFSGKIRQLYYHKNHQKTGTWKYFTEDGKVYKEELYRHDTLFIEPALTSIGKNNDTIITTGWKRTFYYYDNDSNFSLKTETQYKHGVKNGYSIEYLESGNIKKVSHYEDDLLSGKQFEYYYINNLKLISDYKKGKRTGEWIYYDEKGDVINRELY